MGAFSSGRGSQYCAFCACAGWFTSGALLGGFGREAQGGNLGPAAAAAAKTWALGVPLGVAIRSIGRGYVPAMSFIGISLGVTGVLMIGWRAALAALTPEVSSVKTQGPRWAYASQVCVCAVFRVCSIYGTHAPRAYH